MAHVNGNEVETEPSPASSPTRMPKSSSNPRPAVAALALLQHTFGKHILAGTDEWCDVAEVVRSPFLVVSKELKCHDARLRALEANQQQHTMRHEERDRWSVVHAQLKLFGDELQLLTQRLQRLQDGIPQREDVVQEQLAAQWRACAERDARAKHKITKATRSMGMKASRDELQTNVAQLETRVNKQLYTQNTQITVTQHKMRAFDSKMHDFEARLTHLQNNEAVVGERNQTAVRKLLFAQKQCQPDIKRLQRELFVTCNHHCATAQRSRTTEAMPAVNSSLTMTSTTAADEAARLKLKHKRVDDVNEPKPCKSSPQRQLAPSPHESIGHSVPKPSPIVKPTHASLKQRFEDARRKQQACLTRLRHVSH